MEYREMRKFYFECKGDKAKAEAERKARYESPAAERFDFMIGEYPTFLMYNGELQSVLSAIYQKKQALWTLASSLSQVVLRDYMKNMMFDEIQRTNEIENVHSTRREIEEADEGIATGKNARFQGMLRKFQAVARAEETSVENIIDIRMIYDGLLLDDIGKENPQDLPDGAVFRNKRVFVLDTHGRQIHEGLYPEQEIFAGLEKAIGILNDSAIDPLIRMAVFQYVFAYVHPFYDGNGRTARFLASVILARELHPLVGMRISYVIRDHHAKYNSIFKETNDRRGMGDVTRFVIAFLTFVREAIENVAASLSDRRQRLDHYREIINALTAGKKQKRCLYVLLQNKLYAPRGVTIKEMAKACQISESTARNMLGELSAYMDVGTEGRRHLYTLNLDALD